MRFIYFFVVLGWASVFCSCNRDKQVVVHVYDQKLTHEKLHNIMPQFDQNADSMEVLQQYIDAWVARQVMIYEAKKNLSSKEKNFDNQIQEYKESLLIDAYESKMLKQLLDTAVSDEEIYEYHIANKLYFTAKKEWVKVNYIKLPLDFPQSDEIKKIVFKTNRSKQETEMLEDICRNVAIDVNMSDIWLWFDDLLKEIPIVTYNNNELFLRRNKTLELKDKSGIYIVNFLDFKIDDESMITETDRQNIIHSILQQRKIKILKTLRKDAVNKAKDLGKILGN